MSWPRLECWYGITKYPEAAKGSGYRRNSLNCKDVRKAGRAKKRLGELMGAKARERERRVSGRARLRLADVLCMRCAAAVGVVGLVGVVGVAAASVISNFISS